MLALTNGRVFMPNGELQPGTVLIEGDTITSVGGGAALPEGTRIVDAGGGTILPGIIDLHTHLTSYPEVVSDPPVRAGLRASRSALRALAAGITTVRDVGSYHHYDIQLREAINAGTVPGPTMVCAGTFISITGGHGYPRSREADGPDEVRKAAREQFRAGADFVKIMCSGGVARAGEAADAVQFTYEEIRAAVEEAEMAGTVVAAHAHPPRAIKNAVRAGVRSIEHGSFLDEESAAMMAEKDVFLVPTFAVYQIIAESPQFPHLQARAREVLDRKMRAFDAALKAGVPWGIGTDSGAYSPIESIVDELEFMVDRWSMSPKEVLTKATAGNAALLGLDNVGSLAPGKRADVIVVDGDPLAHPSALRSITTTVSRGAVLDWAALRDAYGLPTMGSSTDRDTNEEVHA